MQNKLIASGFISSRILKELIVLSICQKNNLVNDKNNSLLKSRNHLG